MMFESLTLMSFCWEKTSVRKINILMFEQCLGWNPVKICKNDDHTSLFLCINTCWVPCFVFKQLPRDLAVVNA